MNIEFYQDGDRLMARLIVDSGNNTIVEVERKTKGGIVKNLDAYARFAREIAKHKAGPEPAEVAEPVKAKPAKRTRRK